MPMTFEQFIDPYYHEEPRRRPMGELIEELRVAKGQPKLKTRRIHPRDD